MDFLSDLSGRKQIICRDVFPNFDDVLRRKRMKGQSPALPSLRRMLLEQFVLTLAKVFKKFFAVDWLHLTAFQIVIASVKHFACSGELIKIAGHSVLNELVGSASGFRHPAIELRL